MDVDSRIPFGLSTDSGQIVDVGSVERGNACRCICPSCKTPLVARHGTQNAWHFAHRSQKTHNETRNECDYSFAVSVRLMIRQLATNGLKFKVPRLEGVLPACSEFTHQAKSFDYLVTEESLLTLEDVEVGAAFCGETVDVLGLVKSVPFVVHVTYRDRNLPISLKEPQVARSGVIELNVDDLPQLFAKEDSGQYQEVLRRYIEDRTDGKTWAYHPREKKLKNIAIAQRDSWLYQQEAEVKLNTSANFTCRMCGWVGPSIKCEPCDSHLYTSNKI